MMKKKKETDDCLKILEVLNAKGKLLKILNRDIESAKSISKKNENDINTNELH